MKRSAPQPPSEASRARYQDLRRRDAFEAVMGNHYTAGMILDMGGNSDATDEVYNRLFTRAAETRAAYESGEIPRAVARGAGVVANDFSRRRHVAAFNPNYFVLKEVAWQDRIGLRTVVSYDGFKTDVTEHNVRGDIARQWTITADRIICSQYPYDGNGDLRVQWSRTADGKTSQTTGMHGNQVTTVIDAPFPDLLPPRGTLAVSVFDVIPRCAFRGQLDRLPTLDEL